MQASYWIQQPAAYVAVIRHGSPWLQRVRILACSRDSLPPAAWGHAAQMRTLPSASGLHGARSLRQKNEARKGLSVLCHLQSRRHKLG